MSTSLSSPPLLTDGYSPVRAIRCTSCGIAFFAASLLAVGVVLAASASATISRSNYDAGQLLFGVGRQGLFAAAGFAVLLIVSRFGHQFLRWRRSSWIQPALLLAVVAIGCCVAVMIPGVGGERHGARRWIAIGGALGLAFQPSELAKVSLVVSLAAIMSGAGDRIRRFWSGLLPVVLLIGLFAGLVGVEDFGTAALMALVGGAMLLIAGARWRHLILISLPAVAAMVGLVIARPYRVRRLVAFMDIWSDPRGDGYHAIQSLTTIASGGWGGVGLGAGVGKRGYVPESHSDFVFSMLCEETGVIGGTLVVLLFLGLLWCGWRVFCESRSPFARLIAFGVTMTVVLQAVINIAVVTVVAPTKGISLPLVSAGGSGVLFLCVALGLLMSAAKEAESAAPVANSGTLTDGET